MISQEKVLSCFNLNTGNFKEFFDPFREKHHEFYNILFDEDGDLLIKTQSILEIYLCNNKVNWKYDCDFYKLLHAYYFIGNTNGNYTVIYYWR